MDKLKIIYSPLILAIIVFLFHELAIFNLYSGLLDEGFLQYNAHLISQGKIPYKDFFLTTTPGAFYVSAFFYKILGNYIIIGRILGIIATIATLFVCSKLFQLKKFWSYFYLISLSLLSVAPAKTFYYNESSILISLVSLFFFIKGVEKKKLYLIGISGTMTSLCFLFKQSVGGLLFPALILSIFLVNKKGYYLKAILSYFTGGALIIVPVCIYFIINNAISQALYYVFFFAGSVKSHQLSFLIHRLIAIPFVFLFLVLLKRVKIINKLYLVLFTSLIFIIYILLDNQRIGRLLTYLSDPIFYLQTIAFLFPLILLSTLNRKRMIKQKGLVVTIIFYLVFFLSFAASGYNMSPVAVVAPIFIPLLISFSEIFNKKLLKYSKLATSTTAIIIIGYTVYFSQNPFLLADPLFGSYPQSYYKASLNIKEAKFIRFTPIESNDIMQVITYIKKHTNKNEKIFCFPYCPGLLFLSQRDGGSYYNLFYFETFNVNDQEIVINDLKINKVRLVVMQKTGRIEQRTQNEMQRLTKISSYIFSHYSKTLETPNFIVLRIPSKLN